MNEVKEPRNHTNYPKLFEVWNAHIFDFFLYVIPYTRCSSVPCLGSASLLPLFSPPLTYWVVVEVDSRAYKEKCGPCYFLDSLRAIFDS